MICTKRGTCVHNGDVVCLNCNGSENRYRKKETPMQNEIRELLEKALKEMNDAAHCHLSVAVVKILEQVLALLKEKPCDTERLNWLDLHTAFVADGKYFIGPYKAGELRKMADDGIAIEKSKFSMQSHKP